MRKLSSVIVAFLLVLAGTSLFPKSVSAQECGAPVPLAPTKVTAVSGPYAGQVTLYWNESSYANRYAVAYGTTSGKYIYGAHNIGGASSRSYTVKSLTPGKRYYFKLAAARDCSSSPFSKEVSAVASGGAVVTPVTPVTTVTPVTPVTPRVSSGPVGAQKLMAYPGPKTGEVTLSWQHADSADNYHLVYGTSPTKFQYGALNIGKITKFTVSYLVPGKTYYFALVPLMGNRPLYTTATVSASAYLPVEVVVTTKEALIEPPPPVTGETTPPVEEKTTTDDEESRLMEESEETPSTDDEAVMGVTDEQSSVPDYTQDGEPVETTDGEVNEATDIDY